MVPTTRCVVLELCTFIVLILCSTQAVRIDVAPHGAVTIREGTGRIQVGSYELVVITQRPASLQQRYLTPLLQQAQSLLSLARDGKVVNMDTYEARFRRLQAPSRVKRGLINAVGEITKSLFGVATEKDVRKIKDTVNELVVESNTRKVVVRDLIVCVNQTMEQQRRIQKKVNVLAGHVNQLQADLQILSKVYAKVGVKLYQAEMLIIIENVLSLAEEIHNSEKFLMDHFQYKRDLAVVGHLTETLVPRSVLRDVRKKVAIDLSDDYLYANLEVRIMKFDGDSLGFWVSLPILEGEPYTLWRVLTVPFPAHGGHQQIVPEVTSVGHGLETGNYIEADLCKFENPRLCPSPVEYDTLKCVNSILRQEQKQLQICEVVPVNRFSVNVKRVTPTSLVIATDGETIEERCPTQPPQTFQLNANTYLLTANDGCVLEGNNWKFQATRIVREEVEIEDSVILLPDHFNVSFEISSKLKSTKFNYTEIEELVSERYSALPNMNLLSRNIRIVTLSGSVAGYIALIVLVALVIIVFVYRFLKKRSIARRKGVVFHPTVTSPAATEPADDVKEKAPPTIFKQFCASTSQDA